MTEFVYGYDAEYEAFVAARENGHLFQSCLWAGVKPASLAICATCSTEISLSEAMSL